MGVYLGESGQTPSFRKVLNMQRRAIAVMSAALFVLATAASAQDKPNFNGKWSLDAEKSAAANPGGMGGGMGGGGGGGGGGGRGMGGGMGMGMMGGPMTLTVDGASLITERETPNGPMKLTYKLDGSAQQVQMGQGSATAKARWEGSSIVIETTRDFNGNSFTTKAVYAIEGDHLVVSTTSPGRGGGEPMTRKQYYKKG